VYGTQLADLFAIVQRSLAVRGSTPRVRVVVKVWFFFFSFLFSLSGASTESKLEAGSNVWIDHSWAAILVQIM
jgi:hypothetical protein